MPKSQREPELQVISSKDLLTTFAVTVSVLLLGLVLLFRATNGGAAFTTEELRRSEVAHAPRATPNFALVTGSGQITTLHQMLGSGKKVWIVDFVYTRCQTVCRALGSVYQQLQQQILARGLQDQVGLLSMSFDPLNDTPKVLHAYSQRMKFDPAVWQIATLQSVRDKGNLLDTFGIMVIPAPLGEFEHNAALHIIDPSGKLVNILDYEASERAIDLALAYR